MIGRDGRGLYGVAYGVRGIGRYVDYILALRGYLAKK
jgi:hypothetical protein